MILFVDGTTATVGLETIKRIIIISIIILIS